ncbi:LamG-like jellyroll fold domain-containing protein [Teredinibacter turnerae]|uniref:LamG-like jellyroll fold domain-containing protein n=1 Tax=Teredinibacter turnerae TaxID=2426 RepID=UPI0003A24B39|nr:LamG-like jellyroll fold domain-containing protein [Teredinibacter turnerae]
MAMGNQNQFIVESIPPVTVYWNQYNQYDKNDYASGDAVCAAQFPDRRHDWYGDHYTEYLNAYWDGDGGCFQTSILHYGPNVDESEGHFSNVVKAVLKCPEDYGFNGNTELCEKVHNKDTSCPVGNPVYPATGIKTETATDYRQQSPHKAALVVQRQYSSENLPIADFGLSPNWRLTTYQNALDISSETIRYFSGRKHWQIFTDENGLWKTHSTSFNTLTVVTNNGVGSWQLYNANQNRYELYNNEGKLIQVTYSDGSINTLEYLNNRLHRVYGPHNNHLEFSYNNGRLTNITTKSGVDISYEFTDFSGENHTDTYALSRVESSQTGLFEYAYQVLSPIPELSNFEGSQGASHFVFYNSTTYEQNMNVVSWNHAQAIRVGQAQPAGTPLNYYNPRILLTQRKHNGLIKGEYLYDSQGRVIAEHLGESQHGYAFDYQQLETVVTTPLDATFRLSYGKQNGLLRLNGSSEHAAEGTCDRYRSIAYDSDGRVKTKTGFKKEKTVYSYDGDGKVASITYGAGTPNERTEHFQWHPTLHLKTAITLGNLATHFGYSASGQLLSVSYTDQSSLEVRTTQYDYYSNGLIKSIDGPRTDVNDIQTFYYNNDDRLVKIENALGHTISYLEFDSEGRPTTVSDGNGLLTYLSYNNRGKVTDIRQGSRETTLQYDNDGNVSHILLPTGIFFHYDYDQLNRLKKITDSLGNSIKYERDPNGNITAETVYDNEGSLRKSLQFVFDSLERLTASHKPTGEYTSNRYDENDNIVQINNALNNGSDFSYDPFNQLTQISDALEGEATLAYDALGNLTSVTDPENLTTQFVLNAFGETVKRLSPDTGTTDYEYDTAGNLIKKTDNRGVVTNYTYDALNRLTHVLFPDNSDENITYTYDDTAGDNSGIGRLTGVSDQSGTTLYKYNAFGELIEKNTVLQQAPYTQTFNYDDQGRLISWQYPSGRKINYAYDALGYISHIATRENSNASLQYVVKDVQRLPFGAPASYTFGNDLITELNYDLDYKLLNIKTQGTQAIFDRYYRYNLAGNIDYIETTHENGAFEQKYIKYDALNRLVEEQFGQQLLSFTYDGVGNRLTRDRETPTQQEWQSYVYATDSHHLLQVDSITNGTSTNRSISYDSNGNLKDDSQSGLSLSYNQQNRPHSINTPTSSTERVYNALGQRVIRTTKTETTHFIFDEQGRTIGEASLDGKFNREYIYLGSTLVGVVVDSDTQKTVPQVSITHPQLPLIVGVPSSITALATDSDGADLSEAIQWLDVNQNVLATGNSLLLTNSTQGQYAYTAKVAGSSGLEGSATIVVTVQPASGLDIDQDGLPDDWELQYFSSREYTASDDVDGDGLTNAMELQLGADPTVNNPDTDSDGLGDAWELTHFNTLLTEPYADPDGDLVTNLDEYRRALDPNFYGYTERLLSLKSALVLSLDGGSSAQHPINLATLDEIATIQDDSLNYVEGFGGAKPNGALQFNGVNTVIDIANNAFNYASGNEITAGVWIKFEEKAQGIHCLLSHTSDEWFNGYGWFVTLDGTQRFWAITSAGTVDIEADGVPMGEWVHLAFSYDHSAVNLYMNGELVASQGEIAEGARIKYNSGQNLRVGGQVKSYFQEERFFLGELDSLFIANHSLSDSEIQFLATESATDSDDDGVPDSWEMRLSAGLDMDRNTDSDTDELPDYWEYQYFKSLDQTANDDPDGDGLDNLREQQLSSSPVKNNFSNRLDSSTSGDNSVISQHETQFFAPSGEWRSVQALGALVPGQKYYWEVAVIKTNGYSNIGIGNDLDANSFVGATAGGYGWHNNGQGSTWNNNNYQLFSPYYTNGDRVMIAFDPDAGKLWFGVNGVWSGDPEAGTEPRFSAIRGVHYPAVSSYGEGINVYFSPTDFKYAPPSGYTYSAIDSDKDELLDNWEYLSFGSLDESGDIDTDNDGLLNSEEQIFGTDATGVISDIDTDQLPDVWEIIHFGSLQQSGADDFDGDGATNIQEYNTGSDPTLDTNENTTLAVDIQPMQLLIGF